MISTRNISIASLLLCSLGSSSALASEEPGSARSVFLFDKLCYEMVPEFGGLESIATTNKWKEITGAALQNFAPPSGAKTLKAWEFNDFNVPYKIAITQSDMDEQAKESFPDFADAQSYSCSLILPAKAPRAELSAIMEKLMERKPDGTFDQGRLTFDSWNGLTETSRVTINHMGAKNGGPGGLLSVTLMVKP